MLLKKNQILEFIPIFYEFFVSSGDDEKIEKKNC